MEKLIVGLGNPGPSYQGTRHNVGFAVIGQLAADLGAPRPRAVGRALVSEVTVGGRSLSLAQPLTYMNRSGDAVRALLDMYRLGPGDLLVVYDDVQLHLGTLRIRGEGSAGGHNGMKSILAVLSGASCPRLRIGIGPLTPPDMDLADFVLAPFRKEERAVVAAVVETAAEAARVWAMDGIERAMERFNGWRATPL